MASIPFEDQQLTLAQNGYNGLRMSIKGDQLESDHITDYLDVYVCVDVPVNVSKDNFCANFNLSVGVEGASVAALNITDANPGLMAERSYIEAVAGEEVNLMVYISTNDGYLNLLRWNGPNGILQETVNISEKFLAETSRLNISNLTVYDTGVYNCSVARFISSQPFSTSTVIDVRVLVPSNITSPPSNLMTHLHETVTLTCTATGSYPLNITWQRVGQTNSLPAISQPEEEGEIIATVTSTLTIHNVQPDDGGVYRCSATNGLTLTSSTDTADAVIKVVIPSVDISTDIQNVIATSRGERVAIVADIIEFSTPTNHMWYRDQTPLPLEPNRYTIDSTDDTATLIIHNLGDEDLGQYMIVVTDNENNRANDTVRIVYAEPTTAAITPSQLIVDIGEMVEVTCEVTGSIPLSTVWSLADGSTLLPNGVVAKGTRLTIATATPSHTNRYICNVSNTVSSSQATFDLSVFEPLVAAIIHDGASKSFYDLSFRQGAVAPPPFTCVASGPHNASVVWQLSGSASLPSGAMVTGDSELTWRDTLDYTDSGVYECVAMDAVGRQSVAQLDMTVIYDPVIDTVYPAPEVSTGMSAIEFIIPLDFTGTALTCSAFAWPPPKIEWSRTSGALPDGVSATVRRDGGIVVSELVLTNQFLVSSTGSYRCTVQSSVTTDEEVKTVSQQVELVHGSSDAKSTQDCPTILSSSVMFQLRISTSSCRSWGTTRESEIATEFQKLLYRVLTAQCGKECDVSNITLTVVTLFCSDFIDGGVVFRGKLEASSAAELEKGFCALSQWQISDALVTIDGNRFVVDSQCSLRVDSYETDECVQDSSVNMSMVLVIVLPVVGLSIIVVVIIVVVFCSLCYCQCRKNKPASIGAVGTEPHLQSFTRNGHHFSSHNQAHRHSVESMTRQQDNPFYDEHSQYSDRYQPPNQPSSPVYDVALAPDRRPLFSPQTAPSGSAQRDHETAFTDVGGSLNITANSPPGAPSPPHEPRQMTLSTRAQPYQIPTASMTSLTRVGVSNPLWSIEEQNLPQQRVARRFSEGPPSRTPPRANTVSPSLSYMPSSQSSNSGRPTVRHQSHSAAALSIEKPPLSSTASCEDPPPQYSRLNFPCLRPCTVGDRRVDSLNREWYEAASEASYASLKQAGEGSTTIMPYAAIRNSQIATSPLHAPILPPPNNPSNFRGQTEGFRVQGGIDDRVPGSEQFLKRGPPHTSWGSESIPSLPRMQEKSHFETILV
jgi:hypothetical protein